MELSSLGRYELVSPLQTRSDASSIYLAKDVSEHSQGGVFVAKVMNPPRHTDLDSAMARFIHEARLLESFNHPCIPTLHASGEQAGTPFFVMDHVEGTTLAHVLGHEANAPIALPKEIAVYIMGQLCDAVRHAHEIEYMEGDEATPLNMIHRCLCPENILVSTGGDVLLAGFAHATSAWLPESCDDPTRGHVSYKAPERVGRSPQTTQKSDLFSIAVCLWEILRGERCFPGDDEADVVEAIERFDISQSSRRVSGLSPKLSEILRKNLDRDPARRYTGAFQMLQRLAQAPEAAAAEQSREALAKLVREACA